MAVSVDSLDEAAHSWLMKLCAWTGQRGAAIRQYRECCRVLQRELNAQPTRAATELFEMVKSGNLPQKPSCSILVQSATRQADRSGGKGGSVSVNRALQALRDEYRIVAVLVARTADGNRGIAQKEELLLESADAAASRYGGQVIRSADLRVTIAFGQSRSMDNGPELAIRAALELGEGQRKGGIKPAAGICAGGIYMDPVAEANVVVSGSAVARRATSVCDEAPAGTVAVDETVLRLTRRAFEYAPTTAARHGLRRARSVFRVSGIRRGGGYRGETIGRDRELSVLEEALSDPHKGRGGIVSLVGEAGIGKSRLVSELKKRRPR